MTKEQAKEEIKKLIRKYEIQKSRHLLPKYNEAMTRKDFILPLFKALGWDVHNEEDQEFLEEEKAIQGRIDYVCQIENSPKLFLEIKAIKVDLDKEEWAKQVISYAYHKGISWAVLSDFEGIKVFNTEWEVATPEQCKFFELGIDEYLEKFDKIWLLSREECQKESLDKLAAEWGKKPKRISINERLAQDLVRWRDRLKEVFRAYNTIVEETLDEAIQRFLDRLIFIRTIEDRGIEQKYLWQVLQKWISKNRKPGLLLEELRNLFHQYNRWYNSKLFRPHTCDALKAEESYFEEIINDLYRERGLSRIPYDFSKINADVLGSVYEQYLGEVQKRGIKDATRKKHGIYYTPTYIVEYIVNNTLGKLLKEKSLQETKNLKILDPACGSGSFLIKAFEVMNNYLRQEQVQNDAAKIIHHARKFEILSNNIYGVDLDPKATEIARLNLLLKAAEFQEELPMLTDNIKEGNSLISGSEKELKKYFGKDWQDKKPFSWDGEFSEVFQNDGFDVIIGNPPYIQSRNITDDKERHYYWTKYLTDTNHSDVFSFFIQKGISLLRNHGYLGFILPSTWLQLPSFASTRKVILENCLIHKIVTFPTSIQVFRDAQVEPLIIIIQKNLDKNARERNITIHEIFEEKNLSTIVKNKIPQSYFTKTGVIQLTFTKPVNALLDKISKLSITLSVVCKVIGGLRTGEDRKFIKRSKTSPQDRKLLRGRDFKRYTKRWKEEYVWYRPDLMKIKQAAAPKEARFFEAKEKLLIRMIAGGKLIAAYDDEQYYLLQDNIILPKNRNYSLKFILSLLNSKLINFFLKNMASNIAVTQNLLKQIPIRKINFSSPTEKIQHNELVKFADKLIRFNKELQQLDVFDSDKAEKLKAEIQKTDKLIDQKVYELYGLNKKEIEIVEGKKHDF